jgi:hypothetical protein
MAMTIADIETERLEAAYNLAFDGQPLTKIAEAMGVSRPTFFRLKAADASFAQRLARARAEGYDTIADRVLTLVDDDVFDTDPQTLKLKADNMKWYLGVMNPAKYGLRTTVVTEFVDIGAALSEAKGRATIDITPQPIQLFGPDPFE